METDSIYFKRKIYATMLKWKNERDGATALLIQGARRVGKSTIAEQFARLDPPPPLEWLLEAFYRKNSPLAPILSDSAPTGRKIMRKLFPWVVTASDTPKGKPYPDPMLEYLRRTGAAPEEVLYFGDTAYDMDCARSAGVDHALVLWGCLSPEGIEATYRLEKAEEILEFA